MFARHDLVWLSDIGWRNVLKHTPPHHRQAIDQWRQNEWPAVVRRADAAILPDQICLGIALPPDPFDGSKKRIALRASAAYIKKVFHPPGIESVLPGAPTAWRAGLAALRQQARQKELTIRVYGSLALQVLTKQPYLTPASDIDLLLVPATVGQLNGGLDLLLSHAASLPLDGEIIFPSGQAVAWREWCNATRAATGTRVLVKGNQTVSLESTTALLSLLERNPCLA